MGSSPRPSIPPPKPLPIFFSCTIILGLSPLFFYESIHLFCNEPTEHFSIHCPMYTILIIPLLSISTVWLNHQRTVSSILLSTSFITHHSSLIYAFSIPSILMTHNKLLRLSRWATLILNFSLSLHTSISLHTIKQAQVRPHPCKLVAFISYLIAPATFLLLAIQHHL